MDPNTQIAQIAEGVTPSFVTFAALRDAMLPLHQGDKALIDRLHDVWRLGAPSPGSWVRDPAHFDERSEQVGNYVARLILPTKLATWIVEVSAIRGYPFHMRQALNIVYGRADYGFDLQRG